MVTFDSYKCIYMGNVLKVYFSLTVIDIKVLIFARCIKHYDYGTIITNLTKVKVDL